MALGVALMITFALVGCKGSGTNEGPTPTPTPTSTLTPQPDGEVVKILKGAGQYNDIMGDDYSPYELVVSVGATVTWINEDVMPHTVTADDKSFDSGFFGPGESWSYIFTKAGEYPYYCLPHPWMKGKIIAR